ncbi:EPIDERMAL PATTERNING FACTOR-like protein 3 [Humulus lupulus]|uniref:EPIDERMAL PATTERNING FACTOR-like protein 3 n=1 Tax=Humulus lupulus TaxID=3486 RepID=UPI002B4122DB|nr:EPIDERMAL PATTERNING FACTOR-like protein 3 [Humulus lupulus]XP_062087717.1 EPIDERMAL PATTERNING FACTOR-like protein 3 [Humulus lupulus]XP_062087718.1 EPIDERMAL PATTERNING FACTOR-like protein 3 [Humulus lupulus]XP_062087719.1 EPIDERMAL PATTERNING FACTOR-like protein 3 [Humulus lupulus]
MKGRFCFFVIALQVVYWVAATSRAFPPSDGLTIGAHLSGPGQSLQSMKPTSKEGFKNRKEEAGTNESAKYKGMGKIGSSPPSCEHKCYGCVPCEAIQVPTNSRHSHIGIQYANYEPEDWKCKCGLSFYSP